MKIPSRLWMSSILLLGTVVWQSTGLSYRKGEKDVNVNGDKFQDDGEYRFQKKPAPVAKHHSSPESNLNAKENEIQSSRAEVTHQESERKEVEVEVIDLGPKNFLPEESVTTEYSAEEEEEDGDSEISGEEPTIFAVTNTDVGRNWEGIPFREKYLWGSKDALCHPFDLSVPHEGSGNGNLTICIYRREMASNLDMDLLVIPEIAEFMDTKANVYGYVQGYPKSSVVGNLLKGHFFGIIYLDGHRPGLLPDYVVENIHVLTNLMKQSPKLLRNLLIVMESVKKSLGALQLDAIVTTGTSLQRFMDSDTLSSNVKGTVPFLCLNTGHNSYIIPGDPTMTVDEKGRTVFSVGKEVVTIGPDDSVSLILKSKDKEYKFHPNGKSILMEGLNMTSLADQEGPVAISAVSSKFKYGCVIPSPAFSKQRKGGFVCKVCIGLDESFRTNFRIPKNDAEMDIYEFLGDTVDKVSWIFRSVDWDGDGIHDDIGVSYDAQFFHWDYADDGSENMAPEELERFYSELTKMDFTECCLGLVYTMKRFPGGTFAKASSEKEATESGICALKEENGAANNVIIISGHSKESHFSSMTPDQLVYLTGHEIGKAFGGSQDGTGDTRCDSFQDSAGATRHFLLWPDVTRKGITVEEKIFSHCSIESIQKVLNTCRSSCFEIRNEPFCGNGIVEVGEECDCGGEIECAKQHCCFPRNGKYPCQLTGLQCKASSSVKIVGSSFLALVAIFIGSNWASLA